ncbi:unnamed protein product [Musa acuminata subsp. burmannicoides]
MLHNVLQVLLSISSLPTDPTQTLMIHWCRKLLACTRPIVSSTRRPPDLGPRNMPWDKIIQLKTRVASVSESAWLGPRVDVRNFRWNKWDDEVAAPLERFGRGLRRSDRSSAREQLRVSTPKLADPSVIYGEMRPLVLGVVGNFPRHVGTSLRWEMRAGAGRDSSCWTTLLCVLGDDFGVKTLAA